MCFLPGVSSSFSGGRPRNAAGGVRPVRSRPAARLRTRPSCRSTGWWTACLYGSSSNGSGSTGSAANPGLEHVALAGDLDRHRAVEHVEHLLALVGDRLGAVARRLVDDDAAQHVAGEAGGDALVGQRVGADGIDRTLVVAGDAALRPRLRQERADIHVQHPRHRNQRGQRRRGDAALDLRDEADREARADRDLLEGQAELAAALAQANAQRIGLVVAGIGLRGHRSSSLAILKLKQN